jgi:thiamine pyrophosphate-dependent acetolactate synthase large subunit-like protein
MLVRSDSALPLVLEECRSRFDSAIRDRVERRRQWLSTQQDELEAPGVATLSGPQVYLGYGGGAAVGAGPGVAVGAALALKGSGKLPVAVLGDGEMLASVQALWTAAHHRIPGL